MSRSDALRRASPFLRPPKEATRDTFSKAVSADNRLKSWKMKPNSCSRIPGSWFSPSWLITFPLRWIAPSVGRSSAPSISRRVVLPDPEGPMMRTTSPGSMVRETPRTAVTSVAPDP